MFLSDSHVPVVFLCSVFTFEYSQGQHCSSRSKITTETCAVYSGINSQLNPIKGLVVYIQGSRFIKICVIFLIVLDVFLANIYIQNRSLHF